MAKILVVDDDSTFCLMLKTFLVRNGHKVTEAFSFDDARQAIQTTTFDVVLTDFRLPEKSGMDVLTEAKRKNRDTIVIVMTGYGDIRMAVKAIKQGAYDYVTKPVNGEILATINNALPISVGKPETDTDAFTFIEAKAVTARGDALHQHVAPTTYRLLYRAIAEPARSLLPVKYTAPANGTANPL